MIVSDAVGNVVTATQTHAAISGQTGSGGSEVQNFCYDEQSRLLWAGNSGTQPAAGTGSCGSGTLANSISGASYSNTLSYTHLGQLWQGPLNGSGTALQYLYCNSSHPHQLTGLYPTGTTCASLSGASYSASYDAWGNLTSRTTGGSTAALSYDLLDHLVTWNAGSTSQEWYAYDASGNRILRRSTTSSGTSITTYAFGLEEHAYSSTGTNTSNVYYYTLAGRLIGAATGTSTLSTQFFLTDLLGSVLTAFSATVGSAVVLGNQLYGPYGNQRYSKGSMGTAKGYTGQYGDVTGLDYYNARYYDPVVGVFVSADTVQSNFKGFNPYAYVGGNPETMGDPTGHFSGWLLAASVIAVAAAVISVTVASPVILAVSVGVAAAGIGAVTSGLITNALNGGSWSDDNLDYIGKTALLSEAVGAATGFGSFMGAAAPIVDLTSVEGIDDYVTMAAKYTLWNGGYGTAIGTVGGVGGSFIHPPSNSPKQNNNSSTSVTIQPTTSSTGTRYSPTSTSVNSKPSSPVSQSPVSSFRNYTVASGDTLSGISLRFYGTFFQWERIYQTNRNVIGGNPNVIYPGERLIIPH